MEGDSLGRFVARLDAEIIQFARQIPKFEGVNILLRFEDAYDNLMSGILPQLRTMDDDYNQYRTMTFDYSAQSIQLIYKALQIMMVEGKSTSKRLINKWPSIEFFVGYYKGEDDTIEECKRIGFLQDGDFYDSFDLPPAAIGDARCKVVLKLISANLETKQYTIDFIWRLLEEIRKKLVCETVLHSKGKVVLDHHDNIVKTELPTRLRETIASHRSFGSVQRLFSSMIEPYRWASDFTEKGDRAMLTIPLGLSAEGNIQAMADETRELAATYAGFPGFRRSFSRINQYTLDEFFEFTVHLENLARARGAVVGHPVYDGFIDEFKSSCQSLKVRNSAFHSLFDSFSWRPEMEPPTFPLYIINNHCLFSMRQIMLAKLSRPTGIFERYLDSEIKGRYFEIHCRRLLRKEGMKAFPTRIPVTDFLPAPVSFKLWSSQKTKSDIDILAGLGRFLLVIECKDMKRPKRHNPDHGPSHEQNTLTKASVENYYKSTWLNELVRKGGPNKTQVAQFFSDTAYNLIIPITVTNLELRIQGTDDSAAVLSLGDLMVLCRQPESRIVLNEESEAYLKVGLLSSDERLKTPLITLNRGQK